MSETSLSLLQRIQGRGDPEAWSRLLAVYAPLLQHWLRQQRLQPQDVEDVAQEVLVVVVQKLPEFRHNGRVGAFRTWLRMTLVNCLRAHRRRRPPVDGSPEWNDLANELADPGSGLSGQWDREHDAFVLGRLTELIEPEFEPKTWQAFQRTALQGQPTAQVAADLEMSANAVFLAKSRVLARLREEMDQFPV